MEKLTVSVKKGEETKIVIFTDNPDTRIILTDAKGVSKLIKSSPNPQIVGKSPTEVKLTFLFYSRSWNLEIGLATGVLSTGSKNRGLDDKPLLTPDILEFEIAYVEPK